MGGDVSRLWRTATYGAPPILLQSKSQLTSPPLCLVRTDAKFAWRTREITKKGDQNLVIGSHWGRFESRFGQRSGITPPSYYSGIVRKVDRKEQLTARTSRQTLPLRRKRIKRIKKNKD